MDTKVLCRCKQCGRSFEMSPYNLLVNKGCKECKYKKMSDDRRMTITTFLEKLNSTIPNIELTGDYNGMKSKTYFNCKTHNTIFRSDPEHVLRGQTRCQHCKSSRINPLLKTNDQFKEDLRKSNPHIDLIGDYTGAQNRVLVKCKKCGHVWNPIASSLLSGFGCPKCNRSKGEEKIAEYLEAHTILYVSQKRYPDLKGNSARPKSLSYDFYLPEQNLLIEYQGQFHDGTAGFVDKNLYYERQKNNDEIKRAYAKKNGIELLEIWYYDYQKINLILDNRLLNIENPVTTTVA